MGTDTIVKQQIRLRDDELARFRAAIQVMSRQSRVYKMLKDELSAVGRWKNAPRGKPNINLKPTKGS